MAGQRHADDGIHEEGTGNALKRRGLIAGAAALVAGIAAQRAAQPVGATSGGGPDGPLVMGSNFGSGVTPNTLSRLTVQVPTSTWSGSTAAMLGVDAVVAGNAPADTTALYAVGKGSGAGLIGAAGITPANVTGLNAGVYGLATNGRTGVRGESDTGNGVFAQSNSGVGIFGASNISYGVLGASSSAHGVTGVTSGAGFAGLIGQAGANGTTGLVGVVAPGTTGTFAAQFSGPVLVNGALVVGGGKSAAAKHKDGTHRLLYCVEAPEAWFEDFGEGTLVGGRAEVKLDPGFAGVVDTSQMHVFLTEHGDNHNLHVPQRSAGGFTVQASSEALAARGKKAADVTGTFSYRVVARRGDIRAERLATFEMPTVHGVTVPPIPETPKKPPAAGPGATGADTMPGGGRP